MKLKMLTNNGDGLSQTAQLVRAGVLMMLGVFLFGAPVQAATPVLLGQAEAIEEKPVTWYSGTVHTPQEAKLSMESVGRLEYVVDFGQRVEKGQVVAKVSAKELALELSIQRLKQQKEQANVKHLKVELDRLEKLGLNKNISETERAKARHLLEERQFELNHAELQVSLLEEKLSKTQLVAPFNGTVNAVYKKEGEYIEKGEDMLHLVNAQQQEIHLKAPITVVRALGIGEELEISAGKDIFSAQLVTKGVSADHQSRLVELRLRPQARDLTVGQPVRVAIPEPSQGNGVIVPYDAIVNNARGSALFVIGESEGEEFKVKEIPVEVMFSMKGKVAVNAELAVGQKIVIRGATGLSDGQSVSNVGVKL